MNFKHLKSFIEVAQSKSFSTAATRLHTVQSAISRHINALEEDLDVTLLLRNTRTVELTEAGKSFFSHALAIVKHCSDAKEEAKLVQSGHKGLLRIAYLSSSTAHFLPDMLRQFSKQHANVKVKISEMTVAEQLQALSENSIDIGFSRPASNTYKSLLQEKSVAYDPIQAVVSDEHELRALNEVSPEIVAEHPLVLFSRTHAPDQFDNLMALFHERNLSVDLVSEPHSMQALLTEVASGNCVALAPSCVQNLQTYGCTFIPLNPGMNVKLCMHWSKQPSAVTSAWLTWYEEHEGTFRI
ncbi:LysR family transcriptional regulator [Alteromonas sp. BL110]|uniref:LysR substrate-binding domain-containing protein n=1 Tax=Alteromonas sp. BL110 TaxID=1714845 RepID=UPI000E4950F4|nr:LysR family transcriptional regulator [Alteromonas sp. BL110]AXT38283.1 LysR family transcriptional regulator [Alteromonas sp. BL110]RKM83973.1 LysR family transcriptional regulator [Alteromonas sp. BL110]